jgi:hypothetical protein
MDRREERDIMRRGSLSEGEMKQLSQLRRVHRERIELEELEKHRRLEFIRWLVDTGKLTDQIAL